MHSELETEFNKEKKIKDWKIKIAVQFIEFLRVQLS